MLGSVSEFPEAKLPMIGNIAKTLSLGIVVGAVVVAACDDSGTAPAPPASVTGQVPIEGRKLDSTSSSPNRPSAEAVNGNLATTAVSAARATTVVIGPSGAVITALGDTLRLTAIMFDENGRAAADPGFAWSSTRTDVATVDTTGLVTAIGEGRATIEAVAASGENADTASSKIVVVDAARAAGTDRAALIALYVATDGPNWTNDENWLTDAPLDDWYGVEASTSEVVTGVDLYGNGLTGPIPPELGTHLPV
ncbi:MAG: Ig-like domain-containing protein [Gammaproteobacteria bacterium]|nr:Ig-like domain-containing protein [Gammaproteobacteria bacterium]